MRISKIVVSIFMLVLGFGQVIMPIAQVSAVNVTANTCEIDPNNVICKGKDDKVQSIIQTVVDTLLFILGVIAVIMIIIGGFRYTLSGGDSKAVGDAKNAILYAIVGLAIAFSAYATIHYVFDVFK